MQSTYSSLDFFGKHWYGISRWLGYNIVFPENVPDHLYQFGPFSGFSNSKHSYLNLI
jgi:hypothetical protein